MRNLFLLILLKHANADFLCSSECKVVSNDERKLMTNTTVSKMYPDTATMFTSLVVDNFSSNEKNVSLLHIATEMDGQQYLEQRSIIKSTKSHHLNFLKTSQKNPIRDDDDEYSGAAPVLSAERTTTTKKKGAMSGLKKKNRFSLASSSASTSTYGTVNSRRDEFAKTTRHTRRDASFSTIKTLHQEQDHENRLLKLSSGDVYLETKKKAMASF